MLHYILSTTRLSALRSLLIASVAASLAACQPNTPVTPVANSPTSVPANNPSASAELQWARAALERNPNFKVIGIDTNNNAIKLQVRSTGESISVSPGELAAIPIADLMALTHAASPNEATTGEPRPTETVTSEPVTNATSKPTNAHDPHKQFTVQREPGHVRVTGPGVDIESRPNASAAAATKPSTTDEPLICEGRRMMHLDGRHLHVDGDAIVVRGGCELHITNSTIDATGTGIIVENGSVHIGNSTVQGQSASLQLEARAKAYVRSSTFVGISRRDTAAELSDMGGNQWQTSVQ